MIETKINRFKMLAKKTKDQHLMFIGSIIIIIGGVFLLLCMMMASKAHEQPWPRDAYVYYWYFTFPMISIYGITIGVVILVGGLVQSSTLKQRTVSIAFIILFVSPIIATFFTTLIRDMFGVPVHFGLFLISLGGFYLICIGTAFVFSRLYRYIKEYDINEQYRKYKCVECGFKTKRLAFQPIECPQCGKTIVQST